jgi:beta-fructofuranosidase
VRFHFGEAEYLDVVCDADANSLTVDRTSASTDPGVHGGTATAKNAFDDSASRPAARIFIDGSIIEVFTSAGQVLTTRVYPVNPPPWRIEAPEGCTVWTLAADAPSSGSSSATDRPAQSQTHNAAHHR